MPNKKNERGSGNKNTQFEERIMADMRKNPNFMDSPGFQSIEERLQSGLPMPKPPKRESKIVPIDRLDDEEKRRKR